MLRSSPIPGALWDRGSGNTVSGLAAARAGYVHSPRPAGPVIIQLALASVRGYRR